MYVCRCMAVIICTKILNFRKKIQLGIFPFSKKKIKILVKNYQPYQQLDYGDFAGVNQSM